MKPALFMRTQVLLCGWSGGRDGGGSNPEADADAADNDDNADFSDAPTDAGLSGTMIDLRRF